MTAATVLIHGCRSNLAERDALQWLAPDGATVINSCAVTAAAMRDARAAVRRAARRGPVYVTGCAATVAPERFSDLATVVPNRSKLDPAAWGKTGPRPPVFTGQARGFVAIQDGCDHDCTFCVTRIARGRSHSLPLAEVVANVQALADSGHAEVVLTGIDAASYGRDRPEETGLGQLVQAILVRVPGLRRLRLSSLDVHGLDEALFEAVAEPRLMPHLHLSVQSGDDLILKRMKRRHLRGDAIALVERLRALRPGVAIGADFIAGFPTESAAAHANSLALLRQLQLPHAHVFPYSPRPGTAAARMPQVAPAVAAERAAELRAEAAGWHSAFQSGLLQHPIEVVSEGMAGLSPHGFRIRFRQPRRRGALASVVPTAIDRGVLAE